MVEKLERYIRRALWTWNSLPSLQQAPGSSYICLSSENPDLGPQKCNNFGLKSAIRHKVCHVVTKCHVCRKKFPQLTVHDISRLTMPISVTVIWQRHVTHQLHQQKKICAKCEKRQAWSWISIIVTASHGLLVDIEHFWYKTATSRWNNGVHILPWNVGYNWIQ